MDKMTEQPLPQARTEGLVIQELADEVLVYDLDRHKAHCLNQTAALVWRRCDGQTAIKEITWSLEGELKTMVDEEVVWSALEQLSKARLLEARVKRPGAGMSRRDLIRKLGVAAALAAPMVTSIFAPTALAAVSCAGLDCTGSPNSVCENTSGCICSGPNCVPE